jgi:membrane protein
MADQGPGMDAAGPTSRSTAELVRLASEQASRLVGNELQLARAEMTAKARRLSTAAGLFGGAALVALYGVAVVVAALIVVLALLLPAWVAALVIGVLVFATTGVMALGGRAQLRRTGRLAPEQAVVSIKADAQAVAEAVRQRGNTHSAPRGGNPVMARETTGKDITAEDRRQRGHTREERRPGRRDSRAGAADSGERGDDQLPNQPTAEEGPAKPTDLGKRSWWKALKQTVKGFGEDNLSDWAAALTYYAVLSLFPGLLLLISVLRLTGTDTTQRIVDSLTAIAPAPVRDLLTTAAQDLLKGQQSTAGFFAVVGLVGALWSASGYIGAFMRASNAIYDVPEGRPVWKTLPIRIAITIVSGLILTAAALAVVLTGGLARQLGNLLHLGSGVVAVWDIVKWPVLVLMISLLFAVLYWASPNARQAGFRWVTPGSLLAVGLWLLASAGFALYVANFGSYNKTYGSLAAVIIFLVWLWISNLAILLGAEFDAELQRQRAVEAGHSADDEPYMDLRDTRKVDTAPNQELS